VNRTTVFVYASDPLTQAGTAALLRQRHDLLVIEDDPDAATVAVVTADVVDEQVELLVRAIQRNGCPRVVMVIGRLDEAALMAGVAVGACGFVRRSEATAAHLGTVITTVANGDGFVPTDLLGKLLRQVTELHDSVLVPSGVSMNGLTPRELEVLRLVSDGLDTQQIADQLCYSERTVKGVIHDVTTRLNLRNRSHAVAFAMRRGWI